MFIPKKYQQKDLEAIKQLMAEFPLATIVANTSKGLESSHIPLYFEHAHEQNRESDSTDNSIGYLYGHIAKANPLFKLGNDNVDKQWLVIFQDMGHYISPNWYPDKAVTHKAVPTWNYCSVHFKVDVEFTEDVDDLKAYISKLTDRQEVIEDMPWSLSEAPESYVQGLCRAIVGVRLKIVETKAQFKLSQDKDSATKDSVINHLTALNTDASRRMANKMGDADTL